MFIRSILFYLLLGFWTIFLGLLCLPYLLLPPKMLHSPVRLWIRGIFFLLNYICKITHEIKGLKNFISEPMLIASKHQSAFETLALFYYLPKSIFIHKEQLFFIPIFGQFLKKYSMIAINRKGGAVAMRNMLKIAKIKVNEGLSIIIFPEGTRKKPGDRPNYKSGYVGLYNKLNIPILPVAVNSGNFWPKHTFVKKSGHIIIQILPSLPAGIDKNIILTDVEKKIENATNQII